MGKRSIIAVVDDSPVILKAARVALMDEYDVITLPSGQKLFQLLKGGSVTRVLTCECFCSLKRLRGENFLKLKHSLGKLSS